MVNVETQLGVNKMNDIFFKAVITNITEVLLISREAIEEMR